MQTHLVPVATSTTVVAVPVAATSSTTVAVPATAATAVAVSATATAATTVAVAAGMRVPVCSLLRQHGPRLHTQQPRARRHRLLPHRRHGYLRRKRREQLCGVVGAAAWSGQPDASTARSSCATTTAATSSS